MSTPEASARPAQVTVGAWAVAVASVLLLVSVFDALGSLHTIDVRDALAERIRSGNLKGLGITVSEALTLKRWALYVTGLASVVTAVLAIYVLQKDRVARIVLTAAAVPIVLAAPFTGSFLALMVGAGTAAIWGQAGRDWYAGRPITPPRAPASRSAPRPFDPDAPAPPPRWSPPAVPGPGSTRPGATHGWGSPGAPVSLKDLPPPTPLGYAPPRPAPAPTYAEPPRQVRLACILTWIFTTITSLGFLVMLAAVSIDEQGLIDEVKRSAAWDSSNDDHLIVTAAVVAGIVGLVWCAAAATVAVFAWRGARWAWIVLLVLIVPAAILAVGAFPYSLVHLAALGAAFGMLCSPQAREWFTDAQKDPGPQL